MLNVIDISGWQAGLNLATMFSRNPDLGGVVIKASGGVCVTQKTFRPWADWCASNGKPFGMYHFLDDDYRDSSGKAEAAFFVEQARPYFGLGIPVADYEARAKDRGARYLKEFLDAVYTLTGIRPMVYCSLGVCAQAGMKAIAEAGYPLWVAQYPDYNRIYAFQSDPWKRGSVSPWARETMRQYSSQLVLPGWKSHLDADLFYGTEADWAALAGRSGTPEPAVRPTVDELAQEVIAGKWGNGDKRKAALTAAGYDYAAIQRRVNELLSAPKKPAENLTQIAREVIAGKYGNGTARRLKLRAKGYDPDAVQAEVNRILLGK